MMNSFLKHVTSNFYKIAIILISIAIIIYVMVAFRIWNNDWTDYLLKRGRWEEAVFVGIILMGMGMVLTKLYQWFVRLEMRG